MIFVSIFFIEYNVLRILVICGQSYLKSWLLYNDLLLVGPGEAISGLYVG